LATSYDLQPGKGAEVYWKEKISKEMTKKKKIRKEKEQVGKLIKQCTYTHI